MFDRSFFQQDALGLAKQLLGCELSIWSHEGETAGIIVETEAYHQTDPASHSFRGQTPRNATMFKEGGHIYVYRSYGIHACANIVAGKPGVAEGVLIRAMEPTQGLELMRKRRGTKISADLCSGPGRLTQAMGITLEDNGADLLRGRFSLHKPDSSFGPVLSSPRIGITKATDKLWRFYFKNNGNITKHRFNRMGEAT